MTQVSYALREDQNTIFLLQDAGNHYDKYCQITTFERNLVRSEFFHQYLYFTSFTGANGKYRSGITDMRMSIEDNGFVPRNDYVAVIDSEVEFKITPSVIRQLSRDYMPAWGVKSYLDYFSDRKSGVILFLRVFKVNQALSPLLLEKGTKGSSQIIKLYDENGVETTLPIDGIEPVISENKFSYLKDEIIHLLKVENAFIALYDNTDKGLNSLRERIIADHKIQGTQQKWRDRHLQWLENGYDENDGFDMAQLDYDSLYCEVLEISPGMGSVIEYVKRIQAARLGEYDHYLKDLLNNSDDNTSSAERLFDMSLRTAVKNALYYSKRYNLDLEDVFQEACIGILMAIQKYSENVSGLFPSYVSMWERQVMSRDVPPFEYNVHVPPHIISRINEVVCQLSHLLDNELFLPYSFNEIYSMIINNTDCDEKEAKRLAYIISPSESIEEILSNPQKESWLIDKQDNYEEIIDNLEYKTLYSALKILNDMLF